jgi:radical SAM superfamily enzyme YgiQ (UPF0313 family)
MKVVFVNHNVTLWVNLGMTYVMSSVARKHKVYLIDRMLHRDNFSEHMLAEIKNQMPQVVAFSVNNYTVKEAVFLSARIKDKFPDIKVVFGGPGPTILPDETLSFPVVDAICIGEGEVAFLEYLDVLEKGDSLHGVKSIWFKDINGGVVCNGLRPFEQDLDSFPFPNWDFWDIAAYMNEGEITPGTLRVLSSRGCPFSCSFCSNPLWQKSIPGTYYRRRNPAKVIEEIKNNFTKYKKIGFKFLMISDSIFALDDNHTRQFCELYIKAGLAKNIHWGAQVRAGLTDNSLAVLMKKAGCRRVNVSIESGNDYMRNQIYKKNISREQIRISVKSFQQAGILVRSFVMVGGPDDTPQRFNQTLDLAKELGLSISDLIIIRYVPLPKTQLTLLYEASETEKLHSPFSYKGLNVFKSGIPLLFYWKIRLFKVFGFLREGLSFKGKQFLKDLMGIIFKKRSRFIPLVFLCSEQKIINLTIVRYKIEALSGEG